MLGQPVHGPGGRAQQRQERSGSERTGGAAPDGARADEHSGSGRDQDPGGRAGRHRPGRARHGWGWAGRSLSGVEEVVVAGGEEARA
jgi:hypothetical protein